MVMSFLVFSMLIRAVWWLDDRHMLPCPSPTHTHATGTAGCTALAINRNCQAVAGRAAASHSMRCSQDSLMSCQ